ncbi:flavodoxin [Anaerobacillus alkalidiazotrophicus]|uniref:Flavodoxin n=1 Tax=Anaerobacillus alkalidiazotrophicus TaxID=472963 RepID=A0A1S2M2J7_9BACI|nr:flavodoxin [Anaerobacillus alkalidiazotrophicus]OIJ18740.1 flavodoxin [Anaerobacillus alkalidiazotrophicus]
MSNVLLVYASMTGNTEEMANLVEKGLKSEGITVDKKDVLSVDLSTLEAYDNILFGAYTWGEGALPDDFLDLYDDMETMDLTGKTFGVFGTGDLSYSIYCGAVDILEDLIKEKGGKIALEGLKVENFPSGEEKQLSIDFGIKFAKAINLSLT